MPNLLEGLPFDKAYATPDMDRSIYSTLMGDIDGVLENRGQEFEVTTNGMQLTVGTGVAWIKGSFSRLKSPTVITVPQNASKFLCILIDLDQTNISTGIPGQNSYSLINNQTDLKLLDNLPTNDDLVNGGVVAYLNLGTVVSTSSTVTFTKAEYNIIKGANNLDIANLQTQITANTDAISGIVTNISQINNHILQVESTANTNMVNIAKLQEIINEYGPDTIPNINEKLVDLDQLIYWDTDGNSLWDQIADGSIGSGSRLSYKDPDGVYHYGLNNIFDGMPYGSANSLTMITGQKKDNPFEYNFYGDGTNLITGQWSSTDTSGTPWAKSIWSTINWLISRGTAIELNRRDFDQKQLVVNFSGSSSTWWSAITINLIGNTVHAIFNSLATITANTSLQTPAFTATYNNGYGSSSMIGTAAQILFPFLVPYQQNYIIDEPNVTTKGSGIRITPLKKTLTTGNVLDVMFQSGSAATTAHSGAYMSKSWTIPTKNAMAAMALANIYDSLVASGSSVSNGNLYGANALHTQAIKDYGEFGYMQNIGNGFVAPNQ